MSFNLAKDGWIQVLDAEGRSRLVSLREAMRTVSPYVAVRHPIPMITAAIQRLMLAIVHRALRGPADDAEWREIAVRGWGSAVDDYLDEWEHAFDLFDDERPFMQIPDLGLAPTGHGPVVGLALDRTRGVNPTRRSWDIDTDPQPIPAATVAQWLVTDQSWCLGGGNSAFSDRYQQSLGYRSTGPLNRGLVGFVEGSTIPETLILNLADYPSEQFPLHPDDDHATWELHPDELTPGLVRPEGYCDYLTCRWRAVLLQPDPGGDTCTHMQYGAFDQFAPDYQPRDPLFLMGARTDENDNVEIHPLRLQGARHFWRNSFALVPHSSGPALHPIGASRWRQLHADAQLDPGLVPYTVYGVRTGDGGAGSLEIMRGELVPVPTAAMVAEEVRDIFLESLYDIEAIGGAVQKALETFMKAYMKMRHMRAPDNPKKKRRFYESFLENNGLATAFWGGAEHRFREFLPRFNEDAEAARRLVWDAFRTHAINSVRLTLETRSSTDRAWLLACGRATGVLYASIRDAGQVRGFIREAEPEPEEPDQEEEAA